MAGCLGVVRFFVVVGGRVVEGRLDGATGLGASLSVGLVCTSVGVGVVGILEVSVENVVVAAAAVVSTMASSGSVGD